MRLLAPLLVCGIGATYLTIPSGTAAQTPATIEPIVDHIHLNVPDQAKGVEWYVVDSVEEIRKVDLMR